MNKNNLVRIEVKMLTNYERIKNMSIEEMAEFINRLKMNFCEDAFIAGAATVVQSKDFATFQNLKQCNG